jgi:hypothetical protein
MLARPPAQPAPACAVVAKEARVAGEVIGGREAAEHDEPVHAPVRSTNAHGEQLGPSPTGTPQTGITRVSDAATAYGNGLTNRRVLAP